MREKLVDALAEHLSEAIAEITGMDASESKGVALTLFKYNEEDWDVPVPKAMLVDLMTDEVIKKYAFSENESVKKFILIYKEKNSKKEV